MNILLIEDNEIDRMAFLRMVEKEALNCNLEIVDSINKAKSLLSHREYQLVVCDLNLPDGTAFDLSSYFVKNPFILLSGFVDTDLREKAMHSGILKVIAKTGSLAQFPDIMEIIKLKSGLKLNAFQQPKKDGFAPVLSHLKTTFDNNPTYIIEIIQTYLSENPKLLSRLSIAFEIEDNQQIVNTAHKLKSGYMMMGLKELENLSAEIEINSPFENGDLDQQIQTMIKQSQASYHSLNDALLELNKSNND